MFEHTRLLLERYYNQSLTLGISTRGEHLLQEIQARLRELQWIYSRVVSLDEGLQKGWLAEQEAEAPIPDVLKLIFTEGKPDVNFSHAVLPFQTSDELRLLLESFYYSAHRVRVILRDGRKELPGIGSFEAPGVRDVRNHLVEHPSSTSGVLVFSFATGGPVGPQLKPVRWSLDPPGTDDAGLYINASEFEKVLNTILERALSR